MVIECAWPVRKIIALPAGYKPYTAVCVSLVAMPHNGTETTARTAEGPATPSLAAPESNAAASSANGMPQNTR